MMRTFEPALHSLFGGCDAGRQVLAGHAPFIALLRHAPCWCGAIAACVLEVIMSRHVLRVRERSPFENRRALQRSRGRERLPAATPRMRARLVHELEHTSVDQLRIF